MRFGVVTLFPDFVKNVAKYGVISRGFENNILSLECYNPRDFTLNKHNKVDDAPYGGGPGMVMQVQPLKSALEAAKSSMTKARVCYLSPQGEQLKQSKVDDIAKADEIILICGRYEGIDERFFSYIDDEISIGDYVISGGELAAMVFIDAVGRRVPGVLGDYSSGDMDSFSQGILDFPQYTRPYSYDGMQVPSVLLGGDHKKINQWRRFRALEKTLYKRPDLLKDVKLSASDLEFLAGVSKDFEGDY